MKSYRKELWFDIPQRRAMLNITADVQACLRESGIQEGLCLVNAMHITVRSTSSAVYQRRRAWLASRL